MMRVRFWGTRGSLARPGQATLRFGGNTSCAEVRSDDGTLVVLDCGTGVLGLGETLRSGPQPVRGHMLITHTHWDHIQGFPFFSPLFAPGNEWEIYGPGGLGQRLEEALAGQMEYTYFPVTLEQLGATIRYHDVVEGSFSVGGVQVRARYLNHPALTLGYRLEAGGIAVVYAVDHEPHALHTASPGAPLHRGDQGHAGFLEGADLVIHDAQYTLSEYPRKQGWGHSPAEWITELAAAAGVKRLALSHHDPMRDDGGVDALLEACRVRAQAMGARMDVLAAAEGMELLLSEHHDEPVGGGGPSRAAGRDLPAIPATAEEREPATVLVVDDDPDIRDILLQTLEPHGFRLMTAGDGELALRLARRERPDLLLLDWHLPGISGLDVCRELRREPDPRLQGIPILFLTAAGEEASIAAGFEAGATDYVTKPFSPALVRTKVRGWLLRAQGT